MIMYSNKGYTFYTIYSKTKFYQWAMRNMYRISQSPAND